MRAFAGAAMYGCVENPMLDNQKKTRRLIAAMKAALPFEVDLTPEALAAVARNGATDVASRHHVADVSYAGDEGGIMCHLVPGEGQGAIYISLTHVRVPRALSFASAAIEYQRHRTKKLKRQQGHGWAS